MPRLKKEEERKDTTIRAVWASVARYGCSGTTIERVAEIAGFSKGVIHYYFDSKKALLMAAFEAYLKAYEDETVAILARLGREPSAREILEAVVDASLPPFSPADLDAIELPLLAAGQPLGPKYKARLFVQFYSLIVSDQDFARAAGSIYERQGEFFAQCFASIAPDPDGSRAVSHAAGLIALIDGLSLMRVIGYLPAGLPDHASLVKELAIERLASGGHAG
jgi:TetR/AcrR family transcriptional regulator, transcriptional repressor of bet genes